MQVAGKWRHAAPSDFQFCIKAWQLITHTAASPTYRRLRTPIPPGDRDAVGSFRQTEQVRAAWQHTLAVARAVEARVVLFQCPDHSYRRARIFSTSRPFSASWTGTDFRLAWEPRGERWTVDIIRDLCAEYDLIHCVDPFETRSVYGEVKYWRLHGRGSYSYRYTDEDLAYLRRVLRKVDGPGYLMFNNFSSRADADALRFGQLL